VNLLLFVGGAIYLHHRFGRPITESLRTRAANIKAELENAKRRRELAEAKLKQVELRLEQVETEISKIRSEAALEAAAEGDRIRRSTEIEKARIKSQGEKEIANMVKGAQLDVRRFAVAKGIQRAEALIRQDLDARSDARLIEIAAEEFGGRQH